MYIYMGMQCRSRIKCASVEADGHANRPQRKRNQFVHVGRQANEANELPEVQVVHSGSHKHHYYHQQYHDVGGGGGDYARAIRLAEIGAASVDHRHLHSSPDQNIIKL